MMPDDDDDEAARDLYIQHWGAIRTHHTTGQRIQDRFNYRVTTLDTEMWEDQLRRDIFEVQDVRFKINLSYGFILRNNETGQLRYFHPSHNNARVLDEPMLVTCPADFDQFLEAIRHPDVLEWARQKRPDSKWVVDRVTNVTFYVNKILDHPIGCGDRLPDYILNNPAVVGLQKDKNNNFWYRDNLCFFRCLAVWSGCHPHNFSAAVLEYFRKYLPEADPKTFAGVTLDELPQLEKLFDLNINVYELVQEHDDEDDGATQVVGRVVQRSHRQYADTMNINLFKTHFSFIRDMSQYCQSYACSKCGKLWKHVGMLHRHERTCDTNVKHQYVGGTYHLPETIFDKLEDEGIVVPEADRCYPCRITYDFECYFSTDELPHNSEKLTWEARHVPLSVSICSNIPDYETPVCYITEGDTAALVAKMMQHLEAIAERAHTLLLAKFQPIFTELDDKLTDALAREPAPAEEDDEAEKKKHPLEKLRDHLDGYLQEMPVVGFNSGKYDLQVIKPALMSYLQKTPRWHRFCCEEEQQFHVPEDEDAEVPGHPVLLGSRLQLRQVPPRLWLQRDERIPALRVDRQSGQAGASRAAFTRCLLQPTEAGEHHGRRLRLLSTRLGRERHADLPRLLGLV
jgi:hypothetical protein